MTFSELLKKLNPLNDWYVQKVLKELIIFNSKIIENSSDIFFERDTQIDFSYKKINKQLNKVIIKNYPVNYITKSIWFYGIQYTIKKGVFVPRQETEYILDWIVNQKLLDNCKTFLDLCSGSGVLANTISYVLGKRNISVIGIEKHSKPYKIAIQNAKKLKLKAKFIKGDIFKIDKSIYKDVDFIVCNPPYISIDDKAVDISTKKEPKAALFAPENGYYFYFNFIETIYPILKEGTKVVFEIGFNQKEKLEQFLIEKQIKNFNFLNDLNKLDRVLYIVK